MIQEGMEIMEYFEICKKVRITPENLVDLCQMVVQDNDYIILLSMVGFRKMVSFPKNAPMQSIIDANMLPHFLGLLSRSDLPRLQFEVLWTLTNIASGKEEYVQALLDKGAAQIFIALLKGENKPEVKDQAIWALGNIAGDENFFKQQIVSAGAIKPICDCLINIENPSETFIRNACWCLANLCRGRPLPPQDELLYIIPVAVRVVETYTEESILVDAMWTISYISDGGAATVPHILETGCIDTIIRGLFHDSSSVQIPTLRTCGNFVTGSDEQTDVVLGAGLVEAIKFLMDHSEQMIRKEAMWTLSNICAGNENHVMGLIQEGVVDKLVEKTFDDAVEVQREAVWSLSNCTATKKADVIRMLVEKDCIRAMCSWLNKQDSKTLIVILEGLLNILWVGKTLLNHSLFADKLEECGALDLLEDLQSYPNQHVYELAIKLLETYFIIEDVDLSGETPDNGQTALNFAM